MLPGFLPRLHAELQRTLTRPPPSTPPRLARGRGSASSAARGAYDRYAPLRPLAPHIALLNTPSPAAAASARAAQNAGKAPAFTPACLPWVGGSLAGALKTGGAEVPRERWDEAVAAARAAAVDEDGDVDMASPVSPDTLRAILPDWTRSPLPPGAPSAKQSLAAAQPAVNVVLASPRAAA